MSSFSSYLGNAGIKITTHTLFSILNRAPMLWTVNKCTQVFYFMTLIHSLYWKIRIGWKVCIIVPESCKRVKEAQTPKYVYTWNLNTVQLSQLSDQMVILLIGMSSIPDNHKTQMITNSVSIFHQEQSEKAVLSSH
jgi:hypothetical protein